MKTPEDPLIKYTSKYMYLNVYVNMYIFLRAYVCQRSIAKELKRPQSRAKDSNDGYGNLSFRRFGEKN